MSPSPPPQMPPSPPPQMPPSPRRNAPKAPPRARGEGGSGPYLEPGLYLVATPIGNLGDITIRALEVLKGVDAIACEDSRVAAKLLGAYGIATPMTLYHEHNAARVRAGLIERLRSGARIALVSDAGTPLISDPGYKLVAAARAEGIAVTAVPGASALLAALMAAGLPTNAFHFVGFLPPKTAGRRKALAGLRAIPATLVLYESPNRLAALLGDAAETLGPRDAAVCRELTKLHEEIARGPLAMLAARYRDQAVPPKGEIVLVIAPPATATASAAELDTALASALESASLRDAVERVAAQTGLPRRQVYARALALGGTGGTGGPGGKGSPR